MHTAPLPWPRDSGPSVGGPTARQAVVIATRIVAMSTRVGLTSTSDAGRRRPTPEAIRKIMPTPRGRVDPTADRRARPPRIHSVHQGGQFDTMVAAPVRREI